MWDIQEYFLIALHQGLLYPKPVLEHGALLPSPSLDPNQQQDRAGTVPRRCWELVPRVRTTAAKQGEQALGSPLSPAPRIRHQSMGKNNAAQKEAQENGERIKEVSITNHPQNNVVSSLNRVFTI